MSKLHNQINKLEKIHSNMKTYEDKEIIEEEKEDAVDLSWKEAGLGVGIITGSVWGSVIGLLIGVVLDKIYDTHKNLKDCVRDIPTNLAGIMKHANRKY